jgi:uncharacterized protein YbbK (DUF523 family)
MSPEPEKIRLGVSSCLLGHAVRYDGGHKLNAVVVDLLGPSVEWVPVCPEVELGLGIPRPPIQLTGSTRAPRLLVTTTGEDLTERMQRWAARRIDELRALGLHGYVLKSRSPSCGLDDVPVQGAERPGRGAFAAVLVEALPGLAIEDEVRLADPVVRARFLERARAAARAR